MEKNIQPTIVFVYRDIFDGLPYTPKGYTVFNWVDRDDIFLSVDLMEMISNNEKVHPGNNIYIVTWGDGIREIITTYYDAVISFVPKWLHSDIVDSYIPRNFEVVFQIPNGCTTSSVKAWKVWLAFLRVWILKRILKNI